MKLPDHKMPCHVEQPAPTYATDQGYSIRLSLDNSVLRCDTTPPTKIEADDPAAWVMAHVTDRYRAYWLANTINAGKTQAVYDCNEAAGKKRYQRIRRKAK